MSLEIGWAGLRPSRFTLVWGVKSVFLEASLYDYTSENMGIVTKKKEK